MAKKVYAILGASGQIGHVIVEHLLKKGHHVKAIARDKQKLELLKSKGAQIYSLESFEKESLLVKPLQGVDAVFALLPPSNEAEDFSAYQDHVGEAIKAAIKKNSIRYCINLSSIGGQLPDGTGPIKGLYRQEQRLNTLSDVNVLHFRAGYFMENFLMSIPGIERTGTLSLPLNPELSLPLVSTDDIGIKIAEIFDRLDFKGHTVFDFNGPPSPTLKEVTKILGQAIGKPDLKYVQISNEEAKKGFLSAGMQVSHADLFIEMYTSFDKQKIPFTQEITSEHRGKTTIEQFAKTTFAKAFKEKHVTAR